MSGSLAGQLPRSFEFDPAMISTLILLMNAGHEATVHQIGNAVKALIEAGIDVAPVLASDETAARTVEETLRFDTPLHMFKRLALEDLDLPDGRRLRRGDAVALLLGAANRDRTVFDHPGRLDPARAPRPHVAFGGGIHFCIGAPLARLELKVALRTLFRRLPDLRLIEAPRYRDSYHFRGLERLMVSFTPQPKTVPDAAGYRPTLQAPKRQGNPAAALAPGQTLTT